MPFFCRNKKEGDGTRRFVFYTIMVWFLFYALFFTSDVYDSLIFFWFYAGFFLGLFSTQIYMVPLIFFLICCVSKTFMLKSFSVQIYIIDIIFVGFYAFPKCLCWNIVVVVDCFGYFRVLIVSYTNLCNITSLIL